MTQRQEPKALQRLKILVGHDITVNLRSCPEINLTGVLDSFLLAERLLVVQNERFWYFVNWDDVSFLKLANEEIQA